jgi:phenylalanyl-tRNA synthetase beta chain
LTAYFTNFGKTTGPENMLISLEWLGEYIDLKKRSPEEIMTTLTDLGLEVDGVEKKLPLPAGLVVGEIIAAIKHPTADTLQICTVDIGQAAPLTIVCGAANARVGLKAAVAQIGAILPGNFEIKPAKIRGQASEGMMCSQKELKLSDQDAGLWELDPALKCGVPIASIIRTDDVVLEVSLTPNRADCLSYIGIARDLGARLGEPLKLPKKEKIEFAADGTDKHVTVKISESEVCGRFCALYVDNLKAISSPVWMQRRLEASGMRPINVIVDVTNYVLLEYGQPIHAYDSRYLADNKLEVRTALVTDILTTLDGQEMKLKPRDILICDGKQPIGLAGIMGGQNTEIKDDTTAIVIEVAEFNPLQVRRTSKRLGLHTEASHRFERGIDIENLPTVAMRVGELLVRTARELGISAPKVAKTAIDVYPHPRPKISVALRLKRIRKMLGLPTLSLETCTNQLKSLGFTLLDGTAERVLFEVPSWRQDISREVDLIEEIARLEGYDKIPYEMPSMSIAPTPENPVIAFIDALKIALAGMGIAEAITFPFTSRLAAKKLGIGEGHPLLPSLRLANPLSEEMNYMQTTLVSGLVDAVCNNRKQGCSGSRLFEMGRGYFDFKNNPFDKKFHPAFAAYDRPSAHYSERAQKEANRPIERQFVAGIFDWPFSQKSWNQEEVGISFFHGKEIVLGLCKSFGIPQAAIVFERPNPADLPFCHPGASAVLKIQDKILGWIGELHPQAAVEHDFAADKVPCLFELDVDILFEASLQKLPVTSTLSKFPPVTRDIALLADRKVSHEDFERCFQAFPKKTNLRRFDLFDVYSGDKVQAGHQSYAYTLAFQSNEKTLTDKEVDTEVAQLLEWTKKSLNATQR